jgi:Fe2+ transport system protein B
MNLAKHGSMKNSLSLKHLTLAAGILVALIVAVMLASSGFRYSAESTTLKLPTLDLPSLSKVLIQKLEVLI